MTQLATQNSLGNADGEINFGAILDSLFLDYKLITGIALTIALFGCIYAYTAKPVYEANLSVQIEDGSVGVKNILGEAAAMFDSKTAASSEMEILRSRMVVGKAVDSLGLYITAKPKYLPLIGSWLARQSKTLSSPIWGGYVSGSEKIEIATLNIPVPFQDELFTLITDGHGGFTLSQKKLGDMLHGVVGSSQTYHTELGDIELRVKTLEGNAGASFNIVCGSRLKTMEKLQSKLIIAEKGKQSGVIDIQLEGENPALTSQILNEIGFAYIDQNIHRKSEEAEKTLLFLEKELPEIKHTLEISENKYNALRNAEGTIDLGEEGKGLLAQSVSLEGKLIELQQKRDALLTHYTAQHPNVIAIDGQIRVLENQKSHLQGQVKKLPSLEQDILRLTRDVKVNTELYTSLLNTSQQLNLLKASKIGTARIIDVALTPEESVKPKRLLIAATSIIAGLFLGLVVSITLKTLRNHISSPNEIEEATGLPVYATVLESPQQEEFAKKIKAKQTGTFILADTYPDDVSVESLRSFRVALQFAMLDANNNRVMITGASPGIGKTFISVNTAAVLAQAGKRVLLIDMDLHKGHLNQYFGLSRDGGVSDLLSAAKTLGEVIHKNVLQNLDFITLGTRVSNPSSLFLNQQLPTLLTQVSAQYDVVLIDAPPVLLISDVSVIGPHIGTTFLVVRDDMSTIGDIHATQRRLMQAQVAIKGVLFNGQLKRPSGQYGSGYGYGYKYSNYRDSESKS